MITEPLKITLEFNVWIFNAQNAASVLKIKTRYRHWTSRPTLDCGTRCGLLLVAADVLSVCGVKTGSEFIKGFQNKITGSPEGMEDRTEWSRSWADPVEVGRRGKKQRKTVMSWTCHQGFWPGRTEQRHFKRSLNQKADSKTDVLECPLACQKEIAFFFWFRTWSLINVPQYLESGCSSIGISIDIISLKIRKTEPVSYWVSLTHQQLQQNPKPIPCYFREAPLPV